MWLFCVLQIENYELSENLLGSSLEQQILFQQHFVIEIESTTEMKTWTQTI